MDVWSLDMPRSRSSSSRSRQEIGNCRYQRTVHRITSEVNCRPLNGRSRLAIPGMLLTSPIRPFYPISQPLQTLQQNQTSAPGIAGNRVVPPTTSSGSPLANASKGEPPPDLHPLWRTPQEARYDP